MAVTSRTVLDSDAAARAVGGAASGSGRQGGYVVEMQRRRLLTAAVDLVGDGGVQAVTVAGVCQRAGVSRKTFYDLFAGREECLLAAFEEAVTRAEEVVLPAYEAHASWRERMRGGLVALLSFLDESPTHARLLIVEALSAGPRVIERRAEIADALIAAVDEGRSKARPGTTPPPLAAEAVVGAVFAVVHARLLSQRPGDVSTPLIELAGQLMGVMVYPYLGSSAAQREVDTPMRGESPARQEQSPVARDPFKDLSMRLTYRTARVLTSIAASQGASSRQVAVASGVADAGQMSRLLSRLERYSLIENTRIQAAKGEAKSWVLTDKGHGLLQAIGASSGTPT